MASTLDITVSSSQILASQIYLKSTNSRYIRGPLILPGVTKCFAIFVQILGVDVTWVLQISNQVPVQSLHSFEYRKYLSINDFAGYLGHFMGPVLSFSGIWSSIVPAACLLTLPAVIPPANHNAGSIVPALWLVKWVCLHLEHTARVCKIILKYAHNKYYL